jgi:hypothetical protein
MHQTLTEKDKTCGTQDKESECLITHSKYFNKKILSILLPPSLNRWHINLDKKSIFSKFDQEYIAKYKDL